MPLRAVSHLAHMVVQHQARPRCKQLPHEHHSQLSTPSADVLRHQHWLCNSQPLRGSHQHFPRTVHHSQGVTSNTRGAESMLPGGLLGPGRQGELMQKDAVQNSISEVGAPVSYPAGAPTTSSSCRICHAHSVTQSAIQTHIGTPSRPPIPCMSYPVCVTYQLHP